MEPLSYRSSFIDLDKQKLPPSLSGSQNLADYFTLMSFNLGQDIIRQALAYLDKATPVFSVGSGNAAVEAFGLQHDLLKEVICIDPLEGDLYFKQALVGPQVKSDVIFIKPIYKYINEAQIPEKASLMLVNPPPEDIYETQAITHHKWKQIMIICELTGGSGSENLIWWLAPKKDFTRNPDYYLEFEAKKNFCIGGLNYVGACIVLNQDKPEKDPVKIQLPEEIIDLSYIL